MTDFLRANPLVFVTLFVLALLTVGFLVAVVAERFGSRQ